MVQISKEAWQEIQNRMHMNPTPSFVRLQMRHSCLMKVKLTMETAMKENDEVFLVDGLSILVDRGQAHYFRNKRLEYLTDVTGFKQFEIV